MAQTRASETALKEEVERCARATRPSRSSSPPRPVTDLSSSPVRSLSNEVTHLTPLLAANDALQQTIDHLARLNAASEQEALELIAHNSELAGHANQNQKIRHVAMIREELAESRKVRSCGLVAVRSSPAR